MRLPETIGVGPTCTHITLCHHRHRHRHRLTQTKNQFHNFLDESRRASEAAFSWTFPPQGRIIMFNRPEYIEYIQKTNFENYEKGVFFKSAFADLLGQTGIFVADGHTWKTSRKMASHIFSVNQFRTVVQSVVHNELQSVAGLMQSLTSNPSGAGVVTLPEVFFRYTLSSFAKMAFTSDIGCLRPDAACLSEAVPFAIAFDRAQDHINSRFTRPGWQLWERYTKAGKAMKQDVGVIRGFAANIIKERLREQRELASLNEKPATTGNVASTLKASKEKDLLGLFMDLTQDEEDLLAVVLNFLIAGRDTTAQALSWLFVELNDHPQYTQRIREEIELVFGPSSAAAPHCLEYDRIKDLPYTQACISEAIRLHPPVPKNGKRVLKDDVIRPSNPDLPSVQVYAREQVAWSDWVMARTPEVWGEDCEQYKPERFLAPEPTSQPNTSPWKLVNHGQWKFHAFNGGPRLCLGISLANFEALSFVTSVLPHYDVVQTQNATWPPEYSNSVTHPCKPYKAEIRARKEAV